jgi:hypothetical protein
MKPMCNAMPVVKYELMCGVHCVLSVVCLSYLSARGPVLSVVHDLKLELGTGRSRDTGGSRRRRRIFHIPDHLIFLVLEPELSVSLLPSHSSAIIDIPAFFVERYRPSAHRPEYGSRTSRLTDIILAAIQDDLVTSLSPPYGL